MKKCQSSLVLLGILGVLVSSGLAGCDNNPTKGKEMAQASEPVAPAPAEQAPASAKVIAFSEADSSLKFVGAKVTDKHEGSFEKFSGEITLAANDPSKSEVKLSIDIGSLSIEPAKLKGHLLSADFFDVEKFPTATFQSTSVKPGKENQYEVTGNLELHGKTKSIVFPAEIDAQDGKVDVSAEFGINRKDFGIVYPGMPDDLIKDEVLIKIALQPKG